MVQPVPGVSVSRVGKYTYYSVRRKINGVRTKKTFKFLDDAIRYRDYYNDVLGVVPAHDTERGAQRGPLWLPAVVVAFD